MSVKDQVSANYMARMKAEHAGKPHPTDLQRAVLITGASKDGSIGAAIVDKLRGPQCGVTLFEGDVRDQPQVVEQMNEEFSALIMCHGVTHLDWLEDMPSAKMHEVVCVNLYATAMMASEFVKATMHLPFRKTIIIIGSMAHRAVLNGSAVYCASKAGVAHLSRCLAWELAPKGYDVFCLHPSNTLGTPMTEETIQGLMRYRGLTREDAEAYWGASLPRAEWLTPQDIAELVNFIMSGKGAYLSGAQLELAGGQR